MDKDSYYFPHFYNARNDRKIRRLRKQLGIEGYGIFFMVLEVLREQIDFKYPVEDIDLLADEFGTSEEKVGIIVKNYELFEIDEKEKFFSPKLMLYLEPYFEMKRKRSEAGKLGAVKRWGKDSNAIAEPKQNDSSAIWQNSKVKESKEKKSKVKESKNTYGEYKNVKLKTSEYERLQNDFGNLEELIKFLDEYIEEKGYKSKSHNLAIRRWVVDAVNKKEIIAGNKKEDGVLRGRDALNKIMMEEGML